MLGEAEKGLDRMDSQVLERDNGVKGGFAAATRSRPLTPLSRSNKRVHAIKAKPTIASGWQPSAGDASSLSGNAVQIKRDCRDDARQ
ncbi:MAG: hypothetical protein ACJ8FU_06765 [Xanthobacteraceae bacterium]